MLFKNLIFWVRMLSRQKVYTIVNFIGLSAGLAGFFLLALYILNEETFNTRNKDLDKIYRINSRDITSDITYAKAPYVLGDELTSDIRDGLYIARIFQLSGCGIVRGDEVITENEVCSADKDIFNILTMKVAGGNVSDFLSSPNSVVITRSIAEKYFGSVYPVGKAMTLVNNGTKTELQVSGIIEDLPQNSSFRPSILVSNDLALDLMDLMIITSSDKPLGRDFFAESWDMMYFFTTLIKVTNQAIIPGIEIQLGKYGKDHYKEGQGAEFTLQPYRDIYLGSAGIQATDQTGDRKSIVIYSLVALVLLLTVSFNYILLTNAVMKTRRKELALRIINGSGKRSLIWQTVFENLVFVYLSALFGVLIMRAVLPHISEILFGKLLDIGSAGSFLFIAVFLIIPLLTGILSGLYLGFKISSDTSFINLQFNDSGITGKHYGSILSVVQLIITVTLLICTMTVYNQIKYFTSADIGFDVDKVLSVSVRDNSVRNSYNTIKESFASVPGVESVSGSMWTPPTRNNMTMTVRKIDNPEENVTLQGLMADYGIARTLGLHFIEGRDFDEALDASGNVVIINSSAVKALGITGDVCGTFLPFGQVVGVVEDFHIHSFHKAVPPMIIQLVPGGVRTLLVRYNGTGNNDIVGRLEQKWNMLFPDVQMDYVFLTDVLSDLYSQEKRSASILLIFSVLTMIIALLGIFGMASLNAIQRRREVGIRKVMGAEPGSIIRKFVINYTVLSLVASAIAVPAGYLLMMKWLSRFEYHGAITPEDFIIPALVTTVTVILTVLWHIFRAANTDPVESIRHT